MNLLTSKAKSVEPIENLETVFVAYTQAAVDIATPPIDRSLVASSLPKVAEMKIKGMGKDPAKISKGFDEAQADKSKPVAYTIHADNEVIVTFKVRSRFFKVIQSLFEGTFDVRIGTIEDGKKLLNGFTNPNKGK